MVLVAIRKLVPVAAMAIATAALVICMMADTDSPIQLPSDVGSDFDDDLHDTSCKASRRKKSGKKASAKSLAKAAASRKPKAKRMQKPVNEGPSRRELLEEVMIPPRCPQLWCCQIPRHLDGTLQDDFLEIYSPPRMVPVAAALGLRANLSIDLNTGWNLSYNDDRLRVMIALKSRRPKMVWTCCPCTMLSCIQNLNWKKLLVAKRERDFREALAHLDFSMLVCDYQQRCGRKFGHEHPDSCLSWDHSTCVTVAALAESQFARFDMCSFGLTSKVTSTPMLKPTKVMSNAKELIAKLDKKKCMAAHPEHQIMQGLEGGVPRSEWAQVYPREFCEKVVAGIQECLASGAASS